MRLPALHAATLLLSLPLVVSCVSVKRTPGLMVASDPPGAKVMVDGVDSGFITPCHLGLAREQHVVDLVLPGYQVARFRVHPTSQTHAMRWSDMYQDPQTWHFPGWLNFRDFVTPVKKELGWEPTRIHVPMRLAAD